MVSRVDDRWASKKKDEDGKFIHRPRYGQGLRWVAVWDAPDGEPHTKSFRTQDRAQAHLYNVTYDKQSGTYVSTESGKKFNADLIRDWSTPSLHWKASTRVAAE